MPVTTRRKSVDRQMKHSPVESSNGISPPEALSQNTGVKLRKAVLLKPDCSEILWLGYGEGRCLAVWEQSEGNFDPFSETMRLPLQDNPYDLHVLNKDLCLVSSVSGDITAVTTKNQKMKIAKTFSNLHDGGDSRKLTHFDKTIYSGSSNGTIARLDLESGKVQRFNTGFAGVRSITTLSGGSLLASGHSSGQLLIWDTRDFSNKPAVITPSKNQLDGVTALDTHPAQANVIAFGTNNGAVGFSDIRGSSGNIQPTPYDISSATISDVKFHPQNGDHFVCSSVDGSIVHWDATRINSFAFSSVSRESPWLSEKLGDHVNLNMIKNPSFSAVNSIDISNNILLAACDITTIHAYPSLRFSLTSTCFDLVRETMGVLSRLDWSYYFPPFSSRTFLAHYLPASGAISHTMFAVHIFNPTIISRLFPVGDLAVSNTMLFNANLGIGFYVYFRHHLHRLNYWDRVEFSVLASTLFNFGSLLGAVLIKALIPTKTPTWARSALAVTLSAYLISRARKYMHYVDNRSARGSPSPRRSPIKDIDRNGHPHHQHVINGHTPVANGNGHLPTTF